MTRLSFFFQEAHYKKNYSIRVSCIKSEVHTNIFRLSRCLKVEGFACCVFFWRKMRERKSFFKRRELCKWARDKDTLPQWPKEKPPRQDARNETKMFTESLRGEMFLSQHVHKFRVLFCRGSLNKFGICFSQNPSGSRPAGFLGNLSSDKEKGKWKKSTWSFSRWIDGREKGGLDTKAPRDTMQQQ